MNNNSQKIFGKRVDESRMTVSQLMMPEHANPLGHIHGGVIMKLVDETAAICAIRHARYEVVTVAIDSMTFHSPVQIGDLVILNASVNWVGRTSIEAGVRVMAENLLTGELTHTNSAYVVFVALKEGRPIEVPPLILETEEERRRFAEGEERQQRRLNQRQSMR